MTELAHAGPEHLDAEFVAGYDKKQGYPDPDEDIAAFEAHRLDGSSRLVDVGAGTGQFAIPAARHFGRVTAADVSPVMVSVLRRMADLLRPGGVLRLWDLIFDFEPREAGEVFGGWFAGAAADPADGYTAADYAEHVRTEYSTYRWLLEPLLAAAGFEIVAVSFERRLHGAYTCVKRSNRSV